tara:strand:- start:53 stop:439 length:387 start_codon:yes stop_codon:yes gene_type:complete
MSAGLPPPPTRGEQGDFAWTSWYNSLYKILNSTGSLSWGLVDKAGSSIGDLQSKTHSLLTSVLGTGSYHLSQTEQQRVTRTMTMQSKAGDPVLADITAGDWVLYKNTTSGLVKLWVNDGGTLKSTLLS